MRVGPLRHFAAPPEDWGICKPSLALARKVFCRVRHTMVTSARAAAAAGAVWWLALASMDAQRSGGTVL